MDIPHHDLVLLAQLGGYYNPPCMTRSAAHTIPCGIILHSCSSLRTPDAAEHNLLIVTPRSEENGMKRKCLDLIQILYKENVKKYFHMLKAIMFHKGRPASPAPLPQDCRACRAGHCTQRLRYAHGENQQGENVQCAGMISYRSSYTDGLYRTCNRPRPP